MPYADVNGQRLYYDDAGEGPPVVFSHGYLMDTDMFAPQVAALSGQFRCITWDERGFGRTEFDGQPFTYWDSAADVLGLLDALDIDQAVLAGMSQGGFLSLRAALTAPARVKALVLIDTQAGPEDPEVVPLFRAMEEMWKTQGVDSVAPAVADMILGPGSDAEPWFAKWRALDPDGIDEPFECLVGRDDITGRLGEITCPAIVFHGEADASIPMEKAEALVAGLPGCVGLVRVPGAGHASNLTHAEVVNPPLAEFLHTHA
ncbi:MAG TPA: alpha/beta hydrolase [Acidimicrobiales bacterium]|nr:alpha/beta hydrolase [Acidimicrobiales bacterium]